jgi:hypothetical protein
VQHPGDIERVTLKKFLLLLRQALGTTGHPQKPFFFVTNVQHRPRVEADMNFWSVGFGSAGGTDPAGSS